LAAGIALFIVVVVAPVWFKTRASLFHAFDLGIYAQAAYRIRWADLNPWLSFTCLRVFNDHFDPVIFLAAPLAKVCEPVFAVLTVEHLFVAVSGVAFVLLALRGGVGSGLAAIGGLYVLLNRGTVSALAYPGHTTTWGLLPIVLFFFSLRTRSVVRPLIALVFLLVCREEFVVVGLGVGAWMILLRDRARGSLILAVSALWALFVFVLRPVLFGPVVAYSAKVFDGLRSGPAALFRAFAGEPRHLRRLLEIVAPLIPLAIWRVHQRRSPHGDMLVAAGAVLAVHILARAWGHHYDAAIALFLLLSLVAVDDRPLPRWAAVTSLCFLALSLSGPVQRCARLYGDVFVPAASSSYATARLRALDEAMRLLNRRGEGAALVEGNLAPLLARRADTFVLGGKQTRYTPLPEYRFLLLEPSPRGDPWPLSQADKVERIERWRTNPKVEILRDDDRLFLAEKTAPRAPDGGPAAPMPAPTHPKPRTRSGSSGRGELQTTSAVRHHRPIEHCDE
jgi:hypothetical protein